MREGEGLLRRLRRMPAGEMVDRGVDLARRTVDRGVVRLAGSRWDRRRLSGALSATGPLASIRPLLARSQWDDAHRDIAAHLLSRPARFVVHASMRQSLAARVGSRYPANAAAAVANAAAIARGEYELLGFPALRFGDARPGAIDWRLDPVSGRRAPMVFWADVAYMDAACGDHKIIWELNRHQHWIQLGRAWWLSGDATFRAAFVRELESWMAANPPLMGINWASALELAFRALSWTWAAELFADGSAADGAPWLVDLMLGLDRQLRQVERNLSRYFSPNTHLLGEALALYVCGQAWPEFERAGAWTAAGRQILIDQTKQQVLPDGMHAERSTHYHRYALDFYLLAIAVARLARDGALVDAVEPVARRMTNVLRAFVDERGHMPLIGDDDGGELAPITGRAPYDATTTLAWAASLLDGCAPAAETPEAVLWLTASTGAVGAEHAVPPRPSPTRSVVLASSGYHISRLGRSVLVYDAGEHGFMNGGHAHADALAVTITADGVPLAVDPGTGTYTMDRRVRDGFRSTPAHNTLTLDGRPQSLPGGPFHWRTRAAGRPTYSVLTPDFDYFEADTDAYAPVVHERRVLTLGAHRWIIADRVLGGGHHDAAVHWHLHPDWLAAQDGSNLVRLRHTNGATASIAVPDTLIELLRDDAATGLGRFAPVYGRIVPSTTVRCLASRPAPFWVVSVVEAIDKDASQVRTEGVPVLSGTASDAAAVLTRFRTGCSVTLFTDARHREPATIEIDAPPRFGITTDARALHADIDEDGALTYLVLVDATVARFDGRTGVTVTADGHIPDAAIAFDRQGGPSAQTSGAVRGLSVLADARSARLRHRPTPPAVVNDRGQNTCVESQASPTR